VAASTAPEWAAEIIAVGSEMLTPIRYDTNSLFLTAHLNALGIEVVGKRIVGDDRERLADAITHALSAAQLVILTGGLGPTEDDVTRDAVCLALRITQHAHAGVLAAIEARFARLGRKMAPNNRRQAMVPEGAEIFENPNGTAPGLWIEKDGKVIVLLPGPPQEMRPMVEVSLLPRLRQILPPMFLATRRFRVARMPESELDALIAPVYTKYSNPATTVLAKAGDIEVQLRARASTREAAESLCDEVARPIEELLGNRIYSRNGDPLETAVGHLLRDRGETVAVAESCTGGLLGMRLTETPGSSAWFRGGYIVYHDDLKRQLIGEFHASPVSEEVAQRLAAAARERAGATWGVSITGWAGPDGEQPGLTWIGVAGADGVTAQRFQFFGERDRDRTLAAQTALDLLRLRLL
jgi:nicotinamide-nucleotide amidase